MENGNKLKNWNKIRKVINIYGLFQDFDSWSDLYSRYMYAIEMFGGTEFYHYKIKNNEK